MSQNRYLGIDLGGTYVKYALMDEDGSLLEKDKCPTPQNNEKELIDFLIKLYRRYENMVQGIAMSAPGLIDRKAGVMHNGGSLLYIHEFPIRNLLEEKCKVPVMVENDARCAGLAEIWKGSLSDCKNAVAMILGTAVGGAVIIDRKILSGTHLLAGEFSYMLTDATDLENPKKTLAMCGSASKLSENAARLFELSETDFSGEKLFSLAQDGNEVAITCIRNYARQLAAAILNIQFIVDPERIAIGGGISEQEMLLDMIQNELTELVKVYPHAVHVPEIAACQYHNDSNLIGALYSFLQEGRTLLSVLER